MNSKVVGEGVDLLAVEGGSLRGVEEGLRVRAEAGEVRKASQRRLALFAEHWRGHLGDVDPLNCPSADDVSVLGKNKRKLVAVSSTTRN